MSTQLRAYLEANGPTLQLEGGRQFTVQNLTDADPQLAIATVTNLRGREATAALCPLYVAPNRPGAEVWTVLGARKEIARFALHEGHLITLRQ